MTAQVLTIFTVHSTAVTIHTACVNTARAPKHTAGCNVQCNWRVKRWADEGNQTVQTELPLYQLSYCRLATNS